MRTIRVLGSAAVAAYLLCVSPLCAQTDASSEANGANIRDALGDIAADFWIYEDIQAGFAESRRTGRPLLLSIR